MPLIKDKTHTAAVRGGASETDEQLLSDFRRGLPLVSHDAFEFILKRYEKLIYHVAYRYFNNPQDTLDMAQESVIKIYKGLSRVTLSPGGSLKSWICAVTANTCLDALRKHLPVTEPLPETPPLREYTNHPSAEETAVMRERESEIKAAIAKLPEDYRTLIILRETQDLSYQELADATGVGVNTVKSRLSRARAALQCILDKE